MPRRPLQASNVHHRSQPDEPLGAALAGEQRQEAGVVVHPLPGFEQESLRAGGFGWRHRLCLSLCAACAILSRMSTATVSGRIDRKIDALLVRQSLGKKRCQIVSRDVTEKVLERAYPGIGFRDGAGEREAYLLGHRVAVWEVERVFQELGTLDKTAEHFGWPVRMVKRAMDYARAFPKETERCRVAQTT